MSDDKKLTAAEIERTYQQLIVGYDEPSYVQIRKDAFRLMVSELQNEGAKVFLAEIDKANIPDEAIIVIVKGEDGPHYSILVDDQNRLLTFK